MSPEKLFVLGAISLEGVRDSLLERAIDPTLVTSRRDRCFIYSMVERLTAEGAKFSDGYGPVEALQDLGSLIPRRDGNGRVFIGERQITPAAQRLIDSRLDAPEYDIMSPTGSWGALSRGVRDCIQRDSYVAAEVTKGCTVGCHFCAVAEKGLIQAKIRYLSFLQFLDEVLVPQQSGDYVDEVVAYNNTDNFDAKWLDNGQERDMLDVAKHFVERAAPYVWSKRLILSTGVPLGEELRVMAFLDWLYGGKDKGLVSLRLSRRQENTPTVEAMERLLRYLHGTRGGAVRHAWNRIDRVFTAGERMRRVTDGSVVNKKEILGIECKDWVVVSPTKVIQTVMMPVTPETPLGYVEIPLQCKDGTYRIVRRRRAPEVGGNPYYRTTGYDDPEFVALSRKGKAIKAKPPLQGDPHRAFLRLVYDMSSANEEQRHRETWLGAEAGDQRAERREVSPIRVDAKRVMDHLCELKMQGKTNVVMEHWIQEVMLRLL